MLLSDLLCSWYRRFVPSFLSYEYAFALLRFNCSESLLTRAHIASLWAYTESMPFCLMCSVLRWEPAFCYLCIMCAVWTEFRSWVSCWMLLPWDICRAALHYQQTILPKRISAFVSTCLYTGSHACHMTARVWPAVPVHHTAGMNNSPKTVLSWSPCSHSVPSIALVFAKGLILMGQKLMSHQ